MRVFLFFIIPLTGLVLLSCDRPSKPAYQLDLESLKKIDPSHITYRQESIIKCPLSDPLGLAFIATDQRLAVIGGKQLVRLNLAGKVMETVNLPIAPTAVSSGPGGRVYVAGKTGIQTVDNDGVAALWAPLPKGGFFCSMAGNETCLWAADANRGVVVAYDSAGRTLYTIGAAKAPKDGPHFVLPSRIFDLFPAADGSLWVTNPGHHRLENYRADGSFLGSWGKAGMGLETFCGCCNPMRIAVFPDGRFITVEKGLTRIKEYDQQGTLSGIVAGPSLLKDTGLGLDTVILPDNRVAVLDPAAGVIRVFAKK